MLIDHHCTCDHCRAVASDAEAAELLHDAAGKPVRTLVQFDSFYCPDGGDYLLRPDDDGIAVFGGLRRELQAGEYPARVLIHPSHSQDVVVHALRRILEWVEDSEWPPFLRNGDPAAFNPDPSARTPRPDGPPADGEGERRRLEEALVRAQRADACPF